MNTSDFIPNLYRTIDSADAKGLVSFMTDDSVFRFANMPPVEGKPDIETFLSGFFQSIKAIRHTDLEYWQATGVWFVTGNVNYTRHDNSILKVPFGVLLKMQGEKISQFLVFVDNSELYK